MSSSAIKRKPSSGSSGTCKKKKNSEDTGSAQTTGKAIQKTGLTRGEPVKEVFSIVENDGTVEDSDIWGPTMPGDMRRWLPEEMVMLLQASLVSGLYMRWINPISVLSPTTFKQC